jgi:hypothetical protein
MELSNVLMLHLGDGKNKHISSSSSPLSLQLARYDMYLSLQCFTVSCVTERKFIDKNLLPSYCLLHHRLFYCTNLVINPTNTHDWEITRNCL